MSAIHQNKQPIRRHYLKEWLDARGLDAMSLLDALNDPERSADYPMVGKSQVYRWLQGQLPQVAMQERIAAVLQIAPEALLRHPDTDWMARLFEGKSAEEVDRMKRAIELTWMPPTKNGSGH